MTDKVQKAINKYENKFNKFIKSLYYRKEIVLSVVSFLIGLAVGIIIF